MLIIKIERIKVKAKKILNLNLDFNPNMFISAKIRVPEYVTQGYKSYNE